jgi:hypothetical protein
MRRGNGGAGMLDSTTFAQVKPRIGRVRTAFGFGPAFAFDAIRLALGAEQELSEATARQAVEDQAAIQQWDTDGGAIGASERQGRE